MNFLQKLRFPYRDDSVFGLVMLMTIVIPLSFSLYTSENFETVKYGFWIFFTGLILAGVAIKFRKEPSTSNATGGHGLWFDKRFFLFLSAFIVWSIISVVFSPDKLNSIFGFYYRFDNGLTFYFLWAVFILVLCFFGEKEYLFFLLKILVFDSVFVSVLGILQSQGFAFYGGLSAGPFLRAPSFLGNPNFSSMFTATMLPFVFYFWQRAKNFVAKIYYGLASFVVVVSIIVLSSRGAYLAVIASFLTFIALFLLYSKNKRKFFIFVVFFVFVLLLGGAFVQANKLEGARLIFSFKEENISTRLYAWEVARQAVFEHPFVGVGLGDFQHFFEQNRGRILSSSTMIFDDPHNLFLQLGATGGLPLLLFFVGLLAVGLNYGISSFKKNNDYFGLAGACSLVAFAIAASFTPVAIPCFLVLAIVLVSMVVLRGRTKSLNFNVGAKVKIFLLVLSFVLVYFGTAFIVAEHLFYRATFAYSAYDFPKAEKLTAWAIRLNPTNQTYYLYNLGAKILLGEPQEKIKREEQKLVSLHPKAANSYSMLSTLNFFSYLRTGEPVFFDQAVSAMNQSLLIDPYFGDRYLRLGYFYLYGGKVDGARKITEVALQINPSSLTGWIQLAKIYQISNEKPQMVYALENAFKLRPDLPELKALVMEAKNGSNIKDIQIPLPPERWQLN